MFIRIVTCDKLEDRLENVVPWVMQTFRTTMGCICMYWYITLACNGLAFFLDNSYIDTLNIPLFYVSS